MEEKNCELLLFYCASGEAELIFIVVVVVVVAGRR